MIGRIAATAIVELRILTRNKWLAIAVVLMIGFSALIALAGSAPVGTVEANRLTVTAASLATLMVYLAPLIALLISYDSIAGENARGTLALLLTYPVQRFEILAGKYAAQLIVIALAIIAGIGAAVLVSAALQAPDAESIAHIARLGWSACLLGAAFLAVGNLISAATREPGTAAAVAIAIWIGAVVMYDIALLAALVSDDGGFFTEQIFPWLLLAMPTDAFRLFNLAFIDAGAITGGVAGGSTAQTIPTELSIAVLVVWPVAVTILAALAIRRLQP